MRSKDLSGQATVEAAFLIPVLFLLLLLMLQPGILLYDRMVMEGAASEGCRALATRTADSGLSDDVYKAAIKRHLGSIPQQDQFHVHSGDCSYDITLVGDETSTQVSVTIQNKVKPLPLVDAGATLMGLTDGEGYLTQKVEATMATQDAWVEGNSLGMDPAQWVGNRG